MLVQVHEAGRHDATGGVDRAVVDGSRLGVAGLPVGTHRDGDQVAVGAFLLDADAVAAAEPSLAPGFAACAMYSSGTSLTALNVPRP